MEQLHEFYKCYTMWSVWDEKQQKFLHNHIQDGWTAKKKPTPLFESQQVWAKKKWSKESVIRQKLSNPISIKTL